MTIQELVAALAKTLKGALPGAEAHQIMSPKHRPGFKMKFDTPPRPGAVMILLYEEDGNIQFPLIQRSEYRGVHSGQIALPGGKAEESDADLIETATREAHEELGIDPQKIEIVGSLTSFFVAASNFQILPVVAYAKEFPQFIPDKREVAGVVKADLEAMLDPQTVKEKEITPAEGITFDAPYYDLDGKVVWGATAMMLSEFVTLTKNIYGQ
ncbi:MAG: CoA pyrophosphatase [Cytophagales bacterium]|nr:CoA pyrophosphatase [Cytophagales bacterium]